MSTNVGQVPPPPMKYSVFTYIGTVQFVVGYIRPDSIAMQQRVDINN